MRLAALPHSPLSSPAKAEDSVPTDIRGRHGIATAPTRRTGLPAFAGNDGWGRWRLGLSALAVIFSATAALALDQVRVGKAVPNSFAFGATEVGIEAKTFHGVWTKILDQYVRLRHELGQDIAARLALHIDRERTLSAI